MTVFHSVMSYYSYWIRSTDTQSSVNRHLATDVSREIHVSIFMVARRRRSFINTWSFNNDEYVYCYILCYDTV
jgi:hypothetical protein